MLYEGVVTRDVTSRLLANSQLCSIEVEKCASIVAFLLDNVIYGCFTEYHYLSGVLLERVRY